MEILDFEREYSDFAEQVRNVANEIQYNVTAESMEISAIWARSWFMLGRPR